jgi:hypothetical protein
MKTYLAKYSRGSYDDYRTIDVFVTDDKELAQKWVNKFNTKLSHWKKHFSKYSHEWSAQILDERFYDIINGERFDDIMETNEAFITEIEVR